MAYVWGSAFYGIYFIVSFPGFYYFDWYVDEGIVPLENKNKQQQQPCGRPVTLMDTFTTALMILTLLDFVRLDGQCR